MSDPEIKVNINISDKDIERLEKVKQLLQDIKEIDSSFSLNNVIEAGKDTILFFNCNSLLKKEELNYMQKNLEKEIGYKCIILTDSIKLDKAIRADYAEEKDYTTISYYCDGELIKEETTQYK